MSDDIGRRTGKPVLGGKVPRQDSEGCELFTDYFTVTDGSPTLSPNKMQDGAEEPPRECESSLFLDDSMVLDSLDGSWTQGDSRAGSPVIHPEDVGAGGNSSQLYIIEAMRRHGVEGDSYLHLPGSEEGHSVGENITLTKTDIQAIIAAVPDSGAKGLSDVASEELEKTESTADSGAATREKQLERDGPLTASLTGFRTGEEKPNLLSSLLASCQINANFGRHPLFRTDGDSQLVCPSDTTEGGKRLKKSLRNVSEVIMLDGPKVLWPRPWAGTSLAKPDCTEGETCKKGKEPGTSENVVPEDEQHERPSRQKRFPLLLSVPSAKPKLNESGTENSSGMPLMSRDLWSSGACSKSTQEPFALFAPCENALDKDCGRKSTNERCSGSSQLGHVSSKNAGGGDGTAGATASENPNFEGAYPGKEDLFQEAPRPKKKSRWHSPTCEQQVPDIGPFLDLSLTTRKNSALPDVPTELDQQPLQNQQVPVKKTSFWSGPKSSSLGSQFPRGSHTVSARTELQQPLQDQRASKEKPSFWSGPKPSFLGSQVSEGLCTASAPTEPNRHPLQNQKASGQKPSFWSRPKSSALDSQVPEGSHTASAPTEPNRHPLRNLEVSGGKPSFWSRPKTSALGSQVPEGSHTASAPTEPNQLQNQKASGGKRSFWSPKPSVSGSQASEAGHIVPQKSGFEPMTIMALSCHYSSGRNGRDTSGSTFPNVPADRSSSNAAGSAGIPTIRVWKRRPLLLPNFRKTPASCLEAPPSSALKPWNTDQARVNKSPRKGGAHDEAKVTTVAMSGCQAKALDTSAQTSFICLVGEYENVAQTEKPELRDTFHVKPEELQFKDISLQCANGNTPYSFANYMCTTNMTVGVMRLTPNHEKPPSANQNFDMVLIALTDSVKVTTMGRGWLLLHKGCSFFVRRGVAFTLKNVGTTTAEILYFLALPC